MWIIDFLLCVRIIVTDIEEEEVFRTEVNWAKKIRRVMTWNFKNQSHDVLAFHNTMVVAKSQAASRNEHWEIKHQNSNKCEIVNTQRIFKKRRLQL